MELKHRMSKEQYQKILTDANVMMDEGAQMLLVGQTIADMARERIKILDDGKNKKLSEEVHPAVQAAKFS
jgi:hypothetical protein